MIKPEEISFMIIVFLGVEWKKIVSKKYTFI